MIDLGVLLIIFESRPDCLPQIASLAIRSGNGLLLKGGKEAEHTNALLHSIVADAIFNATEGRVPRGAIGLVADRGDIPALLQLGIADDCLGRKRERFYLIHFPCFMKMFHILSRANLLLTNFILPMLFIFLSLDNYIDLVIPRGSNSLVSFIKSNTKIPVLGHADGVCHVYIDAAADPEKAIKIVVDSKTDYPSACNAMECLLLHKSVVDSGFADRLLRILRSVGVTIHGYVYMFIS